MSQSGYGHSLLVLDKENLKLVGATGKPEDVVIKAEGSDYRMFNLTKTGTARSFLKDGKLWLLVVNKTGKPVSGKITEALAKPRAWEGQRPRCPRFAVARATRTLPLPGFASVSTVKDAGERGFSLPPFDAAMCRY